MSTPDVGISWKAWHDLHRNFPVLKHRSSISLLQCLALWLSLANSKQVSSCSHVKYKFQTTWSFIKENMAAPKSLKANISQFMPERSDHTVNSNVAAAFAGRKFFAIRRLMR